MSAMTLVAALAATLPLAFVLVYLFAKGVGALTWGFFVHMPRPVGAVDTGMANAIAGTLLLVGMASLIGVPIGVAGGLFLAEQKFPRLATVIRFLADVMNGLPSIVVGIFAWEFLVRPVGHFSALAGGIALGLMMIPTVTRTTEEMIRVVPSTLRDAALALGSSHWRTSIRVILPSARGGIATGVLLAVARIAGETAPLLFTALGNQYWSLSPTQPIAAIPLQVFNYAISPYDQWHAQAWAGSLVLIGIILFVSMLARLATRNPYAGSAD
jgi:phosphate transport system permease protein